MTLPVGKVLNDKYTIERVLGKGGFGVTYRALDETSGRYVAIKENYPSGHAQRDASGYVFVNPQSDKHYNWALRHFITEAKMLSRLNHNSIVRGYGAFEQLGTAYFVMEYLEGAPLSSYSPGSLTEEQLRYLLDHLLDALVYLQKHDICHRDIKPANIIIRQDFTPVLIDFGAAKQEVSDETFSLGFMSSGYTPPEQFADNNCLSPSIDVYALGATFYCMITGSPPPPSPARQVNPAHDPYVPLASNPYMTSRYSEHFLRSIDTALVLDRQYRFKNAKEWVRYLKGSFTPRQKPVSHPVSDSGGTLPWDNPGSSPTGGAYTPASGDEIPLSQIVGWVGYIMMAIGAGLLLLIIISLAGAGGSSSAFDSCLPLAIGLVLIGTVVRLILRHISDNQDE